MHTAAFVLVATVALLHVWFFVLESFLWRGPVGRKAIGMSAEQAEATHVLAMNQGVYNLFLSAGLVWALFSGALFVPLATFFLCCVAVAGIVGAVTANPRILVLQTVPAGLALVALLLS